MSKGRDRTISRRSDGSWANKRDDSSKASSVHRTQKEAEQAGRQMLRNQGGGELTTMGRDGKIRSKDTIAPGKYPNPPKEMDTSLDEMEIPDLAAALKDLQDARLEAEEEGFPCPSVEALKNAERVLLRLHDTWACRYEVYPMPDGEIAIHVRGGPRKSVALLFEPEGQVLCLVSLGMGWRRARYSNSATLPDAFVIEALKELKGATEEQIAK